MKVRMIYINLLYGARTCKPIVFGAAEMASGYPLSHNE
jgi:hypothetical protein